MTESNRALIIFARKPEAGRVKTRLAATIGNEKALDIYIRLLKHTRQVALPLDCDKYVFLTEKKHDAFWDGFKDELQQGKLLGDRMLYAFQLLFAKGYKHILIIGTDCPHLTGEIIDKGFMRLEQSDVVLGPATDGGYYLLGMGKPYERIFSNKAWSTASVLRDTIIDLEAEGLSYHLLPVLSDVDEEKDIPPDWLE